MQPTIQTGSPTELGTERSRKGGGRRGLPRDDARISRAGGSGSGGGGERSLRRRAAPPTSLSWSPRRRRRRERERGRRGRPWVRRTRGGGGEESARGRRGERQRRPRAGVVGSVGRRFLYVGSRPGKIPRCFCWRKKSNLPPFVIAHFAP
uniref:Uncharacterized protein n=1 Tax=Oryza sativa subsp. japonica TaxID=39947 RepID=Q6H706_ORYSJ|nr:hypothetical protein [Oryza sativa Japonica Group]BAD25493.1 hypothetical protein [Oryza sativa Japonica Group]